MSSHGIKDRVAIIGMGCTPFREHWDKGTDDLMIDAAKETFASAGLDKEQIDAFCSVPPSPRCRGCPWPPRSSSRTSR